MESVSCQSLCGAAALPLFYEQSVYEAARTVHARITASQVQEYLKSTIVEQQVFAFETPHVAQRSGFYTTASGTLLKPVHWL